MSSNAGAPWDSAHYAVVATADDEIVYRLRGALGRAYPVERVLALGSDVAVVRGHDAAGLSPERVALSADPADAQDYPGASSCRIRWVRDDPDRDRARRRGARAGVRGGGRQPRSRLARRRRWSSDAHRARRSPGARRGAARGTAPHDDALPARGLGARRCRSPASRARPGSRSLSRGWRFAVGSLRRDPRSPPRPDAHAHQSRRIEHARVVHGDPVR